MRPTCSLVALAVLGCLVIGTAEARAEMAVVLVVGKAQAKDRTTVASAVRSAARSGGWQLVEAPLAEPESKTVLACLKAPQRWACVSPVVAGKNIQRLIVVSLDPEAAPDSAGTLSLTEQILLPGSDVATSDQRSCPKCTDEALTRIAFDLTKELLEEAAAGTGRTRIRILSTPPGAWITLDTTNVGLTDHTYSTFPGRHAVTLQRDGYQIETRSVDVIENQETTVAVTLRAVDSTGPTGPTPHPDEHPYLVPALVGGAGVAALAVGVGLQLAADPPPVGQSQPSRLVSAPGVALIAGGSVAIGVSVYLWVRAMHRAPPASTPTVSIAPGGGIIGWTGHF
jgi:hypothetical protein